MASCRFKVLTSLLILPGVIDNVALGESPDNLVGPSETWHISEAHDAASPLLLTSWHEQLPRDCVESDCDDCCDMWREPEPVVRLRFSVPGWLPEVHGSATVRGVEAPVNITTRSLLEAINDINFGIMGRVEADAGRWGLLADGLYLNLSADRDFAGGRINASSGLENAIVDAVITYDLIEDSNTSSFGSSAELLAGGRYWLVGGDVTVTGPRGNSVSTSGTREWVDPIVGARVAAPLSEDLLFRLRGDIGGFGAASDFTWNVEALGEYRCSESCGLQLGYRVLDVDYARGDGFAYDVNYRGPVATIVFDF